MAVPSPDFSVAPRVDIPATIPATSELATAVCNGRGSIAVLDVTESGHETVVVIVSCNTAEAAHGGRIREALKALEEGSVRNGSNRTFLKHLGGKF